MIRQRIDLRSPLVGLHRSRVDDRARPGAGLVRADGRAAGSQGLAAHCQLDQRYRALNNDAANLRPSDFTTTLRLIAGFAGLIAFLIFIYLTLQELPRPYLARGGVNLGEEEGRTTVVKPPAIERVAELAARGNPNVTQAAGRLGDEELNIDIGVRRAPTAADTPSDVRTYQH